MLESLLIDCPALPSRADPAVRELARLYPWVPILVAPGPGVALPPARVVEIAAAHWDARDFDPLEADGEVARNVATGGALALRIREPDDQGRALRVARQALTRYQRFIEGRNLASAHPLFDRALGLHRSLHDLRKPLVAADLDHARDTWRWVLRLQPGAGVAVQLAALFHDVERLESESERRIEQHSRDYRAFKTAHAAGGADRVAGLLRLIDAPPDLTDEVAELVRGHEQPGGSPDKLLVNEADALSFFSLNACGFAAYYGPEHTRRKVAFTVARLSPRGRWELGRIRHRADFQELIDELGPAGSGPDLPTGATTAGTGSQELTG